MDWLARRSLLQIPAAPCPLMVFRAVGSWSTEDGYFSQTCSIQLEQDCVIG